MPSVASLFISRWDGAVKGRVPADLELQLGLAVGRRAYADAVAFFATGRWSALIAAGARPQRLLFASTGTKDPTASPTLYVTGLAAPDTVNTIPEETLLAAGAEDLASVEPIPAAPDEADAMLARFAAAGIDVDALGLELQQKGAAAFVASWTSLLGPRRREVRGVGARGRCSRLEESDERPSTGRTRARGGGPLLPPDAGREPRQLDRGQHLLRVEGEPGLFAVTPTDAHYDTLEPDDIVLATIEGEVVDGRRRPTSEFPLHTLLYQRRSEVGGIVHTHSEAAMTMAALGWALPPILTGFVQAAGGAVATAHYSRPGTEEMADFTAEALAERGACFLRHHGLLAIGADLAHAFRAAAVTEATAAVYLRARAFGPVPEVPGAEVSLIADEWRAQWGRSPSPSEG